MVNITMILTVHNEWITKVINTFTETFNNEVLWPQLISTVLLFFAFFFIWWAWGSIISKALSFVECILGISLDGLRWFLCVLVGFNFAVITIYILDIVLTFESLGVHI